MRFQYKYAKLSIALNTMENKYLYAIGVSAVAAGLGAVLYYLSEDRNNSEEVPADALRRDQVLGILKDLRVEMLTCFTTLSTFARSIKEQTYGKASDSEIKKILSKHSPVKSQIANAEEKVYQKHGTTEKAFKYACEVLYPNDKDVKELIEEIRVSMENAYKGIEPKIDFEVPDFLTWELVLRIVEEMYDATKFCTFTRIDHLKSMGISPSPHSEEFMRTTQEIEAEGEAIKQKLFEKHGIAKLGQPANLVLHNAIRRYSQMNPRFNTQLQRIESNFTTAMEQIMSSTFPESEKTRLNKIFN